MLQIRRPLPSFADREVKTIMLVCIYGHGWVSIAPYTLLAYANKFDVASGFRIVCREFNVQDSTESIVAAIEAEDPDVVGFSTYVFTVQRTLEVVPHLDDRIVILGGPQVAAAEDELLAENPGIDMVITGEAERSFVALLEHFRGQKPLEEVSGLTVREGSTPQLPEALDLDEIPSIYERLFADNPQLENVAIETQRGCPYLCRFCAWSDSRKVRYRGMDVVLDDFSMISAQRTIGHVYLADSSLFLRKPRAKKILRHLIEIGCSQNFLYELNLEHVDDELVDLMAQLPHQEFSFGIQAVGQMANAAMTRKFNKALFKRNYDKIVAKLAKPHLAVDLIYPLPGDTLEGFKESVEFALGLDKLQTLKFNPFILLRGAEFWERREEFGIKLREGDPFHVGECDSFPKEDVDRALRYSFYTLLVFYRPGLRRACERIAQLKGVRLIDAIVDVFESLPLDLFGGLGPPELLLADAKKLIAHDHQRAMIDAIFIFKEAAVIEHLRACSGYDPTMDEILGMPASEPAVHG